MSKKEEFKKFASSHPEFVSHIKDGKMSWQSFYEIYDIYGDDEKAWSSYTKSNETSTTSKTSIPTNFKDITNMAKNINMNSVQKHIGTAQKAIGLFKDLGVKNTAAATGALGALSKGPSLPRPLNKFFED